MTFIEIDRLLLRGWRDDDLAPFAAINADATVMAHFPAILSRENSDALAMRFRRFLEVNHWGLYAVAVKSSERFIGFVGFARAEFAACFTPATEIGWRLSLASWGHGYATEAAWACIAHGFAVLGFGEIVSFTARSNGRSIAVMERIGMLRSAEEDFEHPSVPAGHALRDHVLYRITNPG